MPGLAKTGYTKLQLIHNHLSFKSFIVLPKLCLFLTKNDATIPNNGLGSPAPSMLHISPWRIPESYYNKPSNFL